MNLIIVISHMNLPRKISWMRSVRSPIAFLAYSLPRTVTRKFSCQFAAGPCALDVQQAPEAPLAVTRVSSASDVAADTMRDAHIDVRQDAGEKTD